MMKPDSTMTTEQNAVPSAAAHGSSLIDALNERDAYFNEAARVKDVLAHVIPALERASGLKADDFRNLGGSELTPNETAALWLSRAILEAPNDKVSYHADNAGGAHGKDTNDN